MADEHGFLRWLGRQFGYVAKAVKTDVTRPAEEDAAADVLYRKDTVRETTHPADPNLKLRRTIIDEVVKAEPGRDAPDSGERK